MQELFGVITDFRSFKGSMLKIFPFPDIITAWIKDL